MQDRPNANEILATVAAFLEDELMPALDGPLGYRTRVAANLLRILERESTLGGPALVRERELLCALVGADTDDVVALNARLTESIAAGRVAHDRAWPVLMELARAKLAIARPGYDDYDARSELP